MKVDLHIHTAERSPCARAGEDEQIQAAIAAGLDAIFITDHHRLVPEEDLRRLNLRYAPFHVFGGIEVTTEGEDMLVLGVPDPQLERSDWSYPDLHALVREQHGYLALAHPFRYRSRINIPLENYPPDAVEIYTPNTPRKAEPAIRSLALRLGLHLLSDSDAHSPNRLGTYYNQLGQATQDESELLALLKAGQYTLHVL